LLATFCGHRQIPVYNRVPNQSLDPRSIPATPIITQRITAGREEDAVSLPRPFSVMVIQRALSRLASNQSVRQRKLKINHTNSILVNLHEQHCARSIGISDEKVPLFPPDDHPLLPLGLTPSMVASRPLHRRTVTCACTLYNTLENSECCHSRGSPRHTLQRIASQRRPFHGTFHGKHEMRTAEPSCRISNCRCRCQIAEDGGC
jgi:hypothetical protein